MTQTQNQSDVFSGEPLRRFLQFSWLAVALHVFFFSAASQYADWRTALWSLATTFSYAAIYLLPTVILLALARRGLVLFRERTWAPWTLGGIAIGLTGLTHVLLFADHIIRQMYGFHINGFVLDLVLAPGGIASLGASRSTELTATAVVIAFFLMQGALYFLTLRKKPPFGVWPVALSGRRLLVIVLCLTLGERVAYGFSHAANFQPILFASERYPLYLPMTFRKVAAALGVESGKTEEGMKVKAIELSYPLVALDVQPPAKPLNVVWLVAESLRFDMLDPKIMPELWKFSEQSVRLEKHFSGGNMTQMGVFSMFYGLYGNYWFPMLAARRSPVLMDVLQQQNYQFGLYTSQRFTYPAFDKTVFVHMNEADMHELSGGQPSWRRDEMNIDSMLEFIDKRDAARPFMSYMFFESTHANYEFPESAAIAKPYLEDLNYLTADFAKDIGPIKNRYINAAHHVDGQIARVIEHLRAKKLLDQTVVIVLGDHGEEFMERSRWGHSAEFNRFQTSTPAVIYAPGQAPRVVSGISSHLDIPATLLPLLGVRNDPADYSQGKNLLAPDFRRDYAVAADWNRIAYIGNDYKVTFPYNATGAVRDEVSDGDDRPIADPDKARNAVRPASVEIMQNLGRFSRQKN